MDDAFLQFLDKMDERAKAEKARNARMADHKPMLEVEVVEVVCDGDKLEANR